MVFLVVGCDMDRGQWGNGMVPSGRHVLVPVVLCRAAASPTPWDLLADNSHHRFTRIRAHISPWMELLCRMWDGSSSMGRDAMPMVLLEWGQGSGVTVFHSPCEGPCWQQRSHLDVPQEPL